MSWLHATSSGMPSKVVPALAFSAWSVIVAATRNSPKMRRWLACDDREDAPSPCGVIASIALPLPPLGEAPLPPLPLPFGGIGSSICRLARQRKRSEKRSPEITQSSGETAQYNQKVHNKSKLCRPGARGDLPEPPRNL